MKINLRNQKHTYLLKNKIHIVKMYQLGPVLILSLVFVTDCSPLSKRNADGTCTVTILNDSSVSDLIGAVHTWLRITCSSEVTYFSFSSAENTRALLGHTVPGKSSVDENLRQRTPDEEVTIEITREEYQAMIQAIEEFYRTRPRYSMLPRDTSSYNCVTAANRILSAAGIYMLRGYTDPVILGLRLTTVKSALFKCLVKPNFFMFLIPIVYRPICMLL